MSNCSEPLTPAELQMLKMCFDRTDGMVSFDEAVYLYCLARRADKGCIVEVGTYRGRSSVFLGRGSLDGANVPVYAIDPHKSFVGLLGGVFGPKDRTAFYRTMLDNDCSEIVALINLNSECFCSSWTEPVSLLWIDGDHSYEGVRKDFECWLPHLQPDAVIAFDDATDSKLGPAKLIQELPVSRQFEKVANVGKVVAVRQSHQCEYKGT